MKDMEGKKRSIIDKIISNSVINPKYVLSLTNDRILSSLNIINIMENITNKVGRNHINPIGRKRVEVINDSKENVIGFCIKEESFTRRLFMKKIIELMKRNGIKSLLALFLMNLKYVVLINLSLEKVYKKRNPDMKKNKGI